MHHHRLPRKLALLFSTLFALSSAAADRQSGLYGVQDLVDQGHYRQARAKIRQLLDKSQPEETRHRLLFESERMRRIEKEFTLSEDDLNTAIRHYIPAATADEISRWHSEGLLEYKVIDGERRYFDKAAYNLLHISDAAARRSEVFRHFSEGAPLYGIHSHHREIIRSAAPVKRRIRVDYTLSVKKDAIPPGETVRAWLPFPQELPGLQENIKLLASSPADFELAPRGTPQRTIHFQKEARADSATEFRVSYSFDSIARFTPIDPHKVEPLPADSGQAPFLGERPPHIRFTPELRTLSKRIVGNEGNPYRIAQKLFAYVGRIPWAGAREYSTIRNISQYAADAGHADCGQKTLLLMTLMRLNGIPARWQSGWEFSPGSFDTMHDWGELYLAPYGWLPMDVTHGKLAGNTERETWFYLGGLDAYRLVFNTDYGRPFVPAKRHFRSETVDSQRGEVEWRGGNLYFDQWDYQLDWQLVEEN
ncbi:transglutaminase-like domain-containing protein [Microbulbifer halophilus]|uniref:Transglutaminase-like domain-containing protein n=1 Tax=Microbulbifer halophilus TaxID=453963 RepID=A0ABW5ECR4_9GAMM|nr:transglutaminase domain-containing protein [Microbulbifer halophilus]MCW8126988.1 transglutaminase domain-containing protein [Microbulbifer halophilus]